MPPDVVPVERSSLRDVLPLRAIFEDNRRVGEQRGDKRRRKRQRVRYSMVQVGKGERPDTIQGDERRRMKGRRMRERRTILIYPIVA